MSMWIMPFVLSLCSVLAIVQDINFKMGVKVCTILPSTQEPLNYFAT